MLGECENCGGVLEYSPKNKANHCSNCGSLFPVKMEYNFIKKSFTEMTELDNQSNELAKSVKNLKCNSCGASVLLNKYQIQSNCPYCGNTDITENGKHKLMYVDSIVPFSFGKAEALSKFKSTVQGRFFANKKIFKNIKPEDVNGAYINAFVFDLNTTTSYKGVFSYRESYRDKDGKTQYRTRHKHVEGVYDYDFKNVTVEANSNLNQDELTQLLPYNYTEAVTFKEDFMNGYMMEYHDKMFVECVIVAEKIIKGRISSALLKKYNCDHIEHLSLNVSYNDRKYNYCLLPVYFVSTVNKDKKYKAVINGQTGKVGKLPKNKWKVFLTVFGIVGIVVAIIMAITLAL